MKKSRLLAQFITTGKLAHLQIGMAWEERKGWLVSTHTHKNGEPSLYKGELEGIAVNVSVTPDKKIEAFTIYLHDQKGRHIIKQSGKKLSLKQIKVDQMAAFLNKREINWRFKIAMDKIVFFEMPELGVELLFSYFPKEKNHGLITIQTWFDKDNLPEWRR
ncbi:hypothetical protein [Chitinophaga sp. YR627]|uniref:hypothetical protein n=1 Tax=Chitinophaga sp. YR627 TaxID=1881041 RepID=UPI001160C4D0|nr:hypothetical protein [Chitinophaga sp. YR627]